MPLPAPTTPVPPLTTTPTQSYLSRTQLCSRITETTYPPQPASPTNRPPQPSLGSVPRVKNTVDGSENHSVNPLCSLSLYSLFRSNDLRAKATSARRSSPLKMAGPPPESPTHGRNVFSLLPLNTLLHDTQAPVRTQAHTPTSAHVHLYNPEHGEHFCPGTEETGSGDTGCPPPPPIWGAAFAQKS